MIKIYTRSFCSFCTAAKQLLEEQGYDFEEVSLEVHPELTEAVFAKAGQRTVPQIFVGEHSVGGFRELYGSMSSDEFARLIAEHSAAGSS